MNEIAKRASGLAGGLRQRLQALRGKRQKQLQRSARLRVRTTLVEGLEQRLPLTAYLFVDYGDNFPAGVLSTTQGAFRDVADSPNPGDKILGTQLLDASDNFNAGTQLDIVAQSFTAQERADMLEIVSRAFRPIDMEVVELTSSPLTLADGRTVAAATTMNDVINTLRGGSASAKDAYVFVATFIVDPGGADEKTYGPGGGGLSPDSPTLGVNSDLVDAANNHDDVAVVYSDGGFSLNTANNIAHEAGHLLGLQHSITDATNQANVNLFHQLEIMSYQNTNDTSSSAFTRFPMIRGDDNSPSSGNLVDYNDLAARNGQTTIYDQLAADPNVGPNPNFTFITGTGAHDIITISRNGAVADVTIEAFGDAAYTSAITVPGEGDNVYSYSIPLTRPILVYAGGSDDRVVIKGDLGVDVEIDGMLGTDSLVVDAQGAANVQHRPNPTAPTGADMVPSFGGTVQVGMSSIRYYNYEGASSVSIQNAGTYFVQGTPGDDQFKVEKTASGYRVSGTVNGSTAVTPITVSGVNRIAVQTDAGNDELHVDSTGGLVDVPGGITYDGGTGFDELHLVQTGGPTHERSTLHPGQDWGTGRSLIVGAGSQQVDFTNLEPILDAVPAASYHIAALPGLASLLQDDNQISYSESPLGGATWGRVTVDAFEFIDFTNKTELVLDAGAGSDSISLNNPSTPTGLTNIRVIGGDPTASDAVVVTGTSAQNTVEILPTGTGAATITEAGRPTITLASTEHLTYDGGGGSDLLTVSSPDGVDLFDIWLGSEADAGSITVQKEFDASITYPRIDYRNLGSTAELTVGEVFAGIGPSPDKVAVHGTDADERFHFGFDGFRKNLEVTRLFAPLEYIPIFPISEDITMRGYGGEDWFIVDGPLATNIKVEGGNISDGDQLRYHAFAAPGATTTIGGFGIMQLGRFLFFTNIAKATVLSGPNDLNVTSTAGPIDVIPSPVLLGAPNSASFRLQDAPDTLFEYSTDTGTVTFDQSGATLTPLSLNVWGTELDNTMSMIGNTITVDTIQLVAGPNVDAVNLHGLDGNDTITLTGVTRPNVMVSGGAGDDSINAEAVTDDAVRLRLFGDDGNDTIVGADSTTGSALGDFLFGGPGDDYLEGGRGRDLMDGGDGSDTIVWVAGDGTDLIEGGAGGADKLLFIGNTGDNRIDVTGGGRFGSTANPAPGLFDPSHLNNPGRAILALNSTGPDTAQVFLNMADVESLDVDLDEGADTFVLNNQSDATTTTGSAIQVGTDLAHTSVQNVAVSLGGEAANAVDAVEIHGTGSNDAIDANLVAGAIAVSGMSFGVQVRESQRDDAFKLLGQAGDDTIKVASDPVAGVESVAVVSVYGGAGNDHLSADALIFGGPGDDFLEGGAGDDSFFGGDGEDTMIGHGGNDTYDGGAGFDTLLVRGTSGADQITVNQSAATTVTHTINGATETETLVLTAGVKTVEALRLESGSGADTIRVSWADGLGIDLLDNALRMDVVGGADATSDTLAVFDEGTGDLVVHRIGADGQSGSFQIGPGNNEPLLATYSDVEYATAATPAGSPNDGDVVVFKHDPFESNNRRDTATFIGSGATLNVDPTIDPGPDTTDPAFPIPGDEDYYRFVAEATGTLDFQVYFEQIAAVPSGRPGLPVDGDLQIEVLDAAGNVITGFGANDANDDERVRIPAVAGQTYYLHVFGLDGAINAYSFTVINTPAPVPTDIELNDLVVNGTPNPPGQSDNSDTGRSNRDNITYDNTPTIYFRLDDDLLLEDLPGNPGPDSPPDEVIPIPFNTEPTAAPTTAGYRVAVFIEGDPQQTGQDPQVPIGYARKVAGVDGVYVFDFATDALAAPYTLADGSHFLSAKVQMIDPANPLQTGFGSRSQSLEIIVDTAPPAVHFGLAESLGGSATTDGLHPDSDTGVAGSGNAATLSDRITSDSTPTFWGTAEANAIVRAYVDVNANGIVDATDVFIGAAVAQPLDGNEQFGNIPAPGGLGEGVGAWQLTSVVDLNDPAAFPTPLSPPIDGLRTILITAEDVAGNITDPTNPALVQQLNILLDTQGPRVTDVRITGQPAFNLFDVKDGTVHQGPTPAVNGLDISISDLPARVAGFLYDALQRDGGAPGEEDGLFRVVGDHSGVIAIRSIDFIPNPVVAGAAATGTVRLTFFSPLPDDRFTLTVSDGLVDPAGNALDGESNASEPNGAPSFPSGDGVPGGSFVARFTVDSRPEVGVISTGVVYVDINGNGTWDPEGQDNDATNRDLVFQIGRSTDAHFAGNFAPAGAASASGFDKLGVYGQFGGVYTFLIDTDDDGVGDFASAMPPAFQVNGIPVAGDFSAAHPGDEIGLFDGSFWYLDIDGDNVIELGERFTAGYNGIPVVGDFNGDGSDDLAVFDNATNRFTFDTNRDGVADFTWDVTDDVGRFVGMAGFTDRPVAGDLNLDGIDDIGLWVKDREGTLPRNSGEFFFWVSDRLAANPADVFDAYSPAPLGNDLFFQFGDDYALPIFGNFDPPIQSSSGGLGNVLHRSENRYDINGDGFVTPLDALLVINALNRGPVPTDDPVRALAVLGNYTMDANNDRAVSPIDALLVINALNRGSARGEGEFRAAALGDRSSSVYEQAVDEVLAGEEDMVVAQLASLELELERLKKRS